MKKSLIYLMVVVLAINLLGTGNYGHAAGAAFDYLTVAPAQQAKGVAADTKNLVITFDRQVKTNLGDIIVNQVKTDNSETEYTRVTVSPVGSYSSVVNIPLPENKTMDFATVYHVIVPAGAFIDQDGSLSNAFEWTYTTIHQNSSAPTASLVTPVVGSNSVSLTMNFDQPVTKGNGKIYIKRASTNAEVISFPVTDARIVLANLPSTADPSKTVTQAGITVSTSSFAAGERYYILMDPGTFVNEDTLSYAGITSAQSWFFNLTGSQVALASTVPGRTQSEAVTNKLTLQFSRPVYPDHGNISVQLAEGTEVYRIPVTSDTVNGGGTSTITVTLPASLKANTSYKVVISEGAFEDTDHHSYPGSGGYNWSFKTGTSTSSSLTISSFNPTDKSTNVSLSSTIKATFNRSIKGAAANSFANGTNGVTLRKSGTTTIPNGTVTIGGSTLTITLSQSLDSGAVYYVDIAANSILDASTGAAYTGLSGASSWSFSTLSPDLNPPVLQNVQMYSNSVILLQYNKDLDASVALLTTSFSVNVNGESRKLSNVYASGRNVYVTLDTGVAVGQVIKISYSSSSVRSIQDLSGNKAASFSNRDVTNGVDSVTFKPTNGYVSGNTLVLQFPNSLKTVSGYAYNQFSVTQDGSGVGVSGISMSGSTTIYLTLSSAVGNGSVVKVSYSPGGYPLQDYNGTDLSGFSDFFVRNTYDTVPPVFMQAAGSDKQIVLTYNEALSPTSVPMNSQFSVLVNNTPVYVTAVAIMDNQVKLTLASALTSNQNVTVSYVAGSTGISDLSGNRAVSINLQPVSYSITVDGVKSASINGSTLTIEFTSSLTYSLPTLSTRMFYVMVDGTQVELSQALVSGSVVTLTLAAPVVKSQTVAVSFSRGATPQLYQNGTAVASFSSLPVTNLTTTTTDSPNAGLPSNLARLTASDFGLSGYVLDKGSSAITTATSRAGQTVNKYLLDDSKTQAAYNFIASQTATDDKQLVFEVPNTDKAAYVGVPLKTLMAAYNRKSNASFGVRYGDVLYLIPLDQIPFTDLARTQAASFSNTNLWIQLERKSKNALNVVTSMNAVTVLPVVDPVEIFDSISTTTLAGQTVLDVPGNLYFRTSGNAVAEQTSMDKYDENARKVSFLPTQITSSGSYSVISGKLREGSLIAGPTKGFAGYSDIDNHWAKAAINELGSKLIAQSRSGSGFLPKANITRAEFATYIVKGLGLKQDNSSARSFADVPGSSEASAYIGAAVQAGIVNGVSSTSFNPGSYITREQMALMMVRAMSAAGKTITLNGTAAQQLSKFKDSKSIADQNTVAKAVSAGIIQGTSTGTFNPKGTATRAEAVVMIKRVLDNLNYLQ